MMERLLQLLTKAGADTCSQCGITHLPGDIFCRLCGCKRPELAAAGTAPDADAADQTKLGGLEGSPTHPSGFDPRALLAAAENGDAAQCLAILRDDPHIDKTMNRMDKQGNTALTWAAYKALPDVCLKILALPAFSRLNVIDAQGNSALSWSAYQGLEEVCLTILAREDFKDQHNTMDDDGNTALHWAAERGLVKPCEQILARADFERVDALDSIYNRTALHIAAFRSLPSVCLAILSRRDFQEINAIDVAGNTALHFAAIRGLSEVCKAILGRPDFVEFSGKDSSFDRSAVDWARHKGHDELAANLELWGRKAAA